MVSLSANYETVVEHVWYRIVIGDVFLRVSAWVECAERKKNRFLVTQFVASFWHEASISHVQYCWKHVTFYIPMSPSNAKPGLIHSITHNKNSIIWREGCWQFVVSPGNELASFGRCRVNSHPVIFESSSFVSSPFSRNFTWRTTLLKFVIHLKSVDVLFYN